MESKNPDSYPINSFPSIIKNAILNAQEITQAPLALIASSALGVISLACQNLINVRRPTGQESPVSLYLLSIAESGERKTSVDRLFTQPIREFEEHKEDDEKIDLIRFEAEVYAWKVKEELISSEIKKSIKENQSIDELILLLAEHKSKYPKKPKSTKLIYDDTTPEALKHGLHDRWPSAGLISDEAGSIFNGRAMGNVEMINTLWSGGKIQVDRRGSSNFSISNARLTLSLMVQEKVLEQYFSRRGSEARDTGLLARFLISKPTSTQGTRFIFTPHQHQHHISIFQERISKLLEKDFQNIIHENQKVAILEFSNTAAISWTNSYNLVEHKTNSGNIHSSIKDYAAKFSENVARLAALLHYFEGNKNEIPLETLNSSIKICEWHMQQFQEIFSAESFEIQAMKKLDLWLANEFQISGHSKIRLNKILQFGPSYFRKKERLHEAIQYFLEKDIVRLISHKNTNYVHLNPEYFSKHRHWSSTNGVPIASLPPPPIPIANACIYDYP